LRTETPPKSIYLKDYQPPRYKVGHIDLTFRIFDERTEVHARAEYTKNHDGDEPLVLDGEHIDLKSIRLNGHDTSNYVLDDKTLTLNAPGEAFTLDIVTEIVPEKNTRLEGLYQSGGTYCTQCEAEGFRTITYYQDRPDVLATFTTRIEADRKTCPVLLSNGNPVEDGKLEDGRHYAVWSDPFPKPCYLFALVAGDLVHIQDEFVTKSGRKVDLRIYVRDGDQGQCDHAMQSLKHSMKWDEDAYGREYELDRFNIVAVSDFNMGAMENTSLNIFNTALVLAHPETATDADFERVEGVIAHEYFHNWTGNRVTCRDWFQLSLKEGLTVFRDQEFSAFMNSAPVKRIDSVSLLRRVQFAEDGGPLAHPIRPDNYIEINNFYTVTVYEKGAEVIRMQHTLLGDEQYRKATDLYFDRYDGQAVTCEDFVQCMEDVSGMPLRHGEFFNWYRQAGTPEISVQTDYNAEARTCTLHFTQSVPPTPGQPDKKPMVMPIAIGLVGPNGQDMMVDPPSPASSRRTPGSSGQLAKDPGMRRDDGKNVGTTHILILDQQQQSFTFENIPSRPVPSILRNFSAPVKLTTDLTDDDLRFLMVHDSDGFNRWEAGQTYATRTISRMLDDAEAGGAFALPDIFLSSLSELIEKAMRPDTDKALMARALSLPDSQVIGQFRDKVYPQAIHAVRESILSALAEKDHAALLKLYHANTAAGPFRNDFAARSERSLKNTALRLLSKGSDKAVALAQKQYDSATNMTDRVAALAVLSDSDSRERDEAFMDFYDRFKAYPLVIDKWFSLQATGIRPSTLRDVSALRKHPDFNIRNPNRVRSLYGAFAMNNPVCFHDRSGGGYKFLADLVGELNRANPQIAARMLTPIRDWRRYEPQLAGKIKHELERIAAIKDLSPDVFEVVSKSLAA
jgi:aminopeptidase N